MSTRSVVGRLIRAVLVVFVAGGVLHAGPSEKPECHISKSAVREGPSAGDWSTDDRPSQQKPVLPGALVLDLKGDGVLLTTPADGVEFDIDADGTKERIGWTTVGSDDGWVGMDRNQNGVIDDGSELLGSRFVRTNGVRAGQGFEVITDLFAEAGSPATAQIEAGQPGLERLLLWRDRNADGVCDPSEVERLSAAGIVAIRAGYRGVFKGLTEGIIRRYEGQALVVVQGVKRTRPMLYVEFGPEKNGGLR